MVNAPAEPPARTRVVVDPLKEGMRVGALEVRLARGAADVQAVQELRYRVFYQEMTARPTEDMLRLQRDFDAFDEICDHLLVVDHDRDPRGAVVGTYRLLRRSKVPAGRQFYTANEYDIAKLLSLDGEMVELGRSCVDPSYRSGAAIQILLRGIGAYVTYHDCVAMFGCASLPGTSVDAVAAQLSYLFHRHLAPESIRPRALPECYTAMDRVALDELDERRALVSLPPLVKGYLRAGCKIGNGAVIDQQFQTIDVCVVLHMDVVSAKFRSRYEYSADPKADDA
ncbi:MAG: GNAT family N-acetyltransferase [Alphaproteobacteria bacterium]|nr:GNAT family N-acetyltransferase [Alphaproteobacteria bacterium]